MIVSMHIVVGLRELTRIVVEIIHPIKIISLLAHRGLCLHFSNIFLSWFSLGYVSGMLILEKVEEPIYHFVRHYMQHLP